MTFKKMILSGTLALGLIGCGGDDDAPPVVTCEPTGDTYSYLVNSLVLDDAMDGTSAGFNLDGATTSEGGDALAAGCGKADYLGSDGVTLGVDNQVGPLLGAVGMLLPVDVQDTIDEAINSGQALIVANVEYVDSLTTDDCVGLSLVTGIPIDPPLDPATMLDGTEAIEIDPTSLDPNTGDPLIRAEGEIAAGVLSASDLVMDIAVPFSFMGTDIPISLTVNDATLEADISATDLTNGNIGGSITQADLEDLTSDLLAVVAPGEDTSAILALLGNFLDIHIDATPGADPCDGISAGIIFGAVEAQDVTYP